MTYDIKNIAHDEKTFSSSYSIYLEMTGDNTCTYPSLHVQIAYDNKEKPTLLVKKVKEAYFTPLKNFLNDNRGLDYDLIEAQLASFLAAEPFGVELYDRKIYYTAAYKSLFDIPSVQLKFSPRDLFPANNALLNEYLESDLDKDQLAEDIFMSDNFLRNAFEEAKGEKIRNLKIKTLRKKLKEAYKKQDKSKKKPYLAMVDKIFVEKWNSIGPNFMGFREYIIFQDYLIRIAILLEAKAEHQNVDDISKTDLFETLRSYIVVCTKDKDDRSFNRIRSVHRVGITAYFSVF